jgi:septal ring factor EnvC (AmiA/AmiB activator)
MRKNGLFKQIFFHLIFIYFFFLKTKLESTIDAYKIKLEEMSDLRQQNKYLEETNLRLFDEKSNLEQDYKQAKLLQTQVEFHKKTNQELYQKISELQRIADKAEFERNRTEERLNAINAEKIVRKKF